MTSKKIVERAEFTNRGSSRRAALIALGRTIAIVFALSLSATPSMAGDDVWPELKTEIFGERTIHDGNAQLSLDAPYRAQDAALVPITIKTAVPQSPAHKIKTITLVIDENPVPVAAVFHLAPNSGIAQLSTRVRINAYSHVRAIAEMNDGKLYMVSRFVKASGGCSAPASKNQDQAIAEMGKMRLRQYMKATTPGDRPGKTREAQLQIRHPNHSGLQMDQLTGYYLHAHYVEKIEIKQGVSLILTIDGAISLSEDPTVRFSYTPVSKEKLQVRVVDSEGKIFSGSWSFQEASEKNM